jgi:hypothetical protein
VEISIQTLSMTTAQHGGLRGLFLEYVVEPVRGK